MTEVNVTDLALQLQRFKEETESYNEQVRHSVNGAWLLLTGFLVFSMQTGFAMLEVGSVRKMYTKNILFKNVLDVGVGALCFYSLGFGFAYGDGSHTNHFIGNKYFYLSQFPSDTFQNAFWFFQFSFSATAATIVSGAVAERLRFTGYLLVIALMSTFVYPVAAHWIWSEQGWLSASGDGVWSVGTIDFAGSTVVHCVGGFSALVGAKAVGFRGQYPPLDENEEHVARFEKVKGKRLWRVNPMPANDESLATLGVLLLWFGWYGFNCGSILEIVGNEKIAGRVAINSTLSPSVASLSCILLGRIVSQFKDEPEERRFYLSDALNGILAGLVSITAGCAVVEPWAAIIIGGLSCIVYKTASELLLLFRIDDPVDAAAVHAFCGVWGTIAVGLFASSDHVKEVYGDGAHYGLFMGGGGRRLLMQIVGCSTVILWSLFWSTLMFTFILFANRMTEVFFRTSFFIQKGGQTERLGFGVSKPPTIRIASTFIIPSASLHHGELSRNESTNSVAQEMHSLKSFEQPIDKEGKEDDEDSSDDDGDGRDEKQKGSQNKKTGSQRRLSRLGSSFSSFGSLKGKKEEQSNKIGVQDGGDTPKGPLSKEGSIRLGKKESSPSMASSPKEPKNMESNDSDSTTEESDYY